LRLNLISLSQCPQSPGPGSTQCFLSAEISKVMIGAAMMTAKMIQTANLPKRLRPSRCDMAHSRWAVPAGLSGSASNPEPELGHMIGGSAFSW